MAPLTSSAINKGKKVAPKAAVARRRPAAAQPAAPVQSVQHESHQPAPALAPETAPSTTTSDTTAGASQLETPSTQPEIRASAAPLPTPPATQQSAAQLANSVTEQPVRQPTPTPQASLPHHVEPSPLSLAHSETTHRQTLSSPPAQPPVTSTSPVTQPESRQLDTLINQAPPHPQQSPGNGPSSPNQLAGQKRKRPTPPPAVPTDDPTAQAPPSPVTTQQALPVWEADSEVALINTLIGHQDQPRAPVAQMLPPANPPAAAPKPRAKRQKKTTPTETPSGIEDASPAVDGAQENDSSTTPAAKPKKPRAPRAKRAPKSAATIVEEENENIVEAEESAPRPVPKPRKPRQKKKQPQNTGGEDGTTGQEDPSDDPANHEIDVSETTMFELTKDRGLGKVSERETKMAAIDWDEVHRKRVAEAEAIRDGIDPTTLNTNIQPTENNEGGEGGEGENTEDAPRPAPVVTGPRLRLDAEGNLVVDEDSLRIDRQAQAERNAENLVVTENDDLTKRVNQMSWINERRRDPTDRVPFFKMKSDPWSDEETDRFYEALRMFGTDFFIISKMFQPKTRRQIKLKFIREERLDPDRVNRVLAGEAVPMNLESFAEATGQDLGGFKDPRELEEEMRVEGEEQRVEIARKKKEMEEAKEQRDIQMAAREKDQEERAAQRREKAAMRQNKRRGILGTGTF
ncbi:hypothetical protein KCU62_g4575, partial [Aureobasidium sp. EXF-3399]